MSENQLEKKMNLITEEISEEKTKISNFVENVFDGMSKAPQLKEEPLEPERKFISDFVDDAFKKVVQRDKDNKIPVVILPPEKFGRSFIPGDGMVMSFVESEKMINKNPKVPTKKGKLYFQKLPLKLIMFPFPNVTHPVVTRLKELYKSEKGECLEHIKTSLKNPQIKGNSDVICALEFFKGLILFEQRKFAVASLAFSAIKRAVNVKTPVPKFVVFYNRGLCNFALEKYHYADLDFTIAIKTLCEKSEFIEYYISSLVHHGICHAKLERMEKALSVMDIVIDICSKRNELKGCMYFNRGIYKKKLNRISEALADFEKAIPLNENDFEAYYFAGLCSMQMMNLRDKYDKAIVHFNKGIEKNSKHFKLYFFKSQCYFITKRLDEAKNVLFECLRLYPTHKETLYNLGLCFFDQRNYIQSIKYFTKSLSLGDNHIDCFFYRGLSYIEISQYDNARRDFLDCLKISENRDAYAIYNIGICYYNEKNYPIAVQKFSETLKLIGFDKAYLYRANSYFYMKQNEKCFSDYDMAIKVNPEYAQAYYSKGYCLVRLKQYKEALPLLTKAIEYKYRLDYSYYNRGLCLFNVGKLKEALIDYNISINDLGMKLWFNRGICHTNLEMYEEAIKDFTYEVSRNSNDLESFFQRSKAYFYSKQYDKSLGDINFVLSKIKQGDSLYSCCIFNKALTYRTKKLYNEAIPLLTQCITQLFFKVHPALTNRAFCYGELGMYTESIKDYTEVIETHKVLENLYSRAVMYKKCKRYEEAIADLKRTVDMNEKDFEALFEISECYYFLDDIKKSIEYLKMVVDIKKDHQSAQYNLGLCFYKLKEYHEALKHFKNACNLNYKFLSLYYHYGLTEYQLKNNENAIKLFKKQLDLYPEDESTLFYLGCAQLNITQFKEAIINYTKVLMKNPNHFFSNVNRAICFASLKEVDKALIDLSKAISIDPTYIFCFKRRGQIYHDKGMFELAQKDFEVYLAQKSDDIDVLFKFGICEYEMKRYAEAIIAFNRVISIDPNELFAFYEKGLCFYRLGKFKEALRMYDHMLKTYPNHLDALNNQGLCYIELKDYKSSVEKFNHAISVKSDYYKSIYNRGISYYSLGKYEKSIADFTRALELDPSYTNAYFERGIGYLEMNMVGDALKDLNKFLTICEGSKNSNRNVLQKGYLSRARVLMKMRKFKESIEDFQRVINLNPTLMMAYFDMGTCQMKIMKFEDASKSYTLVLGLSPFDVAAILHRGICFFKMRKFEDAMKDFHSILDKKDSNALEFQKFSCYFYLGCINMEMMKDDIAVIFFEKSIKINPKFELAFLNCGLCYMGLKKYMDALDRLERAFELNSKNNTTKMKIDECMKMLEDM